MRATLVSGYERRWRVERTLVAILPQRFGTICKVGARRGSSRQLLGRQPPAPKLGKARSRVPFSCLNAWSGSRCEGSRCARSCVPR